MTQTQIETENDTDTDTDNETETDFNRTKIAISCLAEIETTYGGDKSFNFSRLLSRVTNVSHLISANKMKNNACIGQINKPIGLIKSKSTQDIARCVISKGSIPKAPTTHIEEGSDNDCRH